MSRFAHVEAQGSALGILERALEAGRVASAYLFEGPSGVGKELTAIALAEAVLDTDAKASARVRAGAHPDVRIFRPRDEGMRNIQVTALREEILPVAQFAPFEAGAAFLIFPEADVSFPEHPPESANALLKTLEEPRPNVHFVLASERPDRLLPTIRSRCQRVRFGRLPADVLERILAAREVPEEARGPAVALADGRADRAIALAEGGAQALLDHALALDDVCATGSPGALTRAAEALAGTGAELPLVLDAFLVFSRDLAAVGLGLPDGALAFRHRAAIVRERAARTPPARAARRAELIRDALVALERNGNRQIVLDSLLFGARM
ncbi:MAG: AAA family ATPase [Sandaracinaceae bacterium]|nr:AAA family ATPase [Sandaracinaceae bacterium]